MKKPIRVSQIGSRGIPGHRGGVERVIEAVTPRLVALGLDVTVYCASWSKYREASYRGVKLRYIYSIPTKYLDTIVRSLLSTLRDIVGPSDIIHCHGSGSAPMALLARLFGKKVVVTVHGLDWQRRKWSAFGRWFLSMGERAAIRLPHQTIVVSEELKRTLDSQYGGKVVYIPNGVEERAQRAPDRILQLGISARKYILYLARLVPEKQCHVLIEAFRSLADKRGFKLIIAGPTWHSEQYVASLRTLAGDDRDIIFLGEVDEAMLEELYSNCYAYVLPSEVEGMSLSLLDAMAFGSCIVASDIAANADLVGDSGVLFKTGNAADLSAKLDAIIANADRAEQYRQKALQRMTSEFNWDRISRQWEAVYVSLT
jgi:glycosyltransferase involved in cell wall biosynthesis